LFLSFYFDFFFSSYQVWPNGCAWVLPWFLDGTNNTVRQPNSGFQDDFLIPTALFPLLGSTCRKNMTVFFFRWEFLFSFLLSSLFLWFQSQPLHIFKVTLLFIFSFRFDSCFLLLFILFWIIYIIEIFFQFNPSLVFFNFHIWFDFLKYSLDWIIFLIASLDILYHSLN
jgi:hypothetical protein